MRKTAVEWQSTQGSCTAADPHRLAQVHADAAITADRQTDTHTHTLDASSSAVGAQMSSKSKYFIMHWNGYEDVMALLS